MRDRRRAEVEPTEQLREEAVADAALREVELALVEQVQEQAQAVGIRERSKHPREPVDFVLRHAPSVRMLSNCVKGSWVSARNTSSRCGARTARARTRRA